MNTIIEKIRAEVNRLKPRIRKICGEEVKIPVEKVREKFDTLLSFLSDLEKEEKPINQDGLEEEIREFVEQEWDGLHDNDGNPLYTADYLEYIARHFYELGLKSKEQPVKTNIVEDLKHYLATTPKEQIEKDWESLKEWGKVGPSVSEFLGWEQPVCEGLEEETERFIETFGWGKTKHLAEKELISATARHFAQWGAEHAREQMMKEAEETELYWDGDFLAIDLNMAALGYTEHDKVRIIIVKED